MGRRRWGRPLEELYCRRETEAGKGRDAPTHLVPAKGTQNQLFLLLPIPWPPRYEHAWKRIGSKEGAEQHPPCSGTTSPQTHSMGCQAHPQWDTPPKHSEAGYGPGCLWVLIPAGSNPLDPPSEVWPDLSPSPQCSTCPPGCRAGAQPLKPGLDPRTSAYPPRKTVLNPRASAQPPGPAFDPPRWCSAPLKQCSTAKLVLSPLKRCQAPQTQPPNQCLTPEMVLKPLKQCLTPPPKSVLSPLNQHSTTELLLSPPKHCLIPELVLSPLKQCSPPMLGLSPPEQCVTLKTVLSPSKRC